MTPKPLLISLLLVITGASCTQNITKIQKENFGTVDGKQIVLFTLANKNGIQLKVTNYGAIVVSLIVPDRENKLQDIVTGYESLDGYISDKSFFGATVGRYGNRINKGKFEIDGKEYQLSQNDGENHLHGGFKGFFKAVWDAEPVENEAGPSLKLTYISPDGEEGYPGTVRITVIYSLTNDNELQIDYTGTTDKSTILNPTHHSYFNLSGDFTKTILDHELMIDADSITPVDSTLIPTGELQPVENTPMDFRKPKKIGEEINHETEQLKFGKGYDHNWVLNNFNTGKIRKAATLNDPSSGRLMEIHTDQPGLQFYSGNFLDGTITGKGGVVYQHRTSLCLEAQHFPDSPNKPQFPGVLIRPGETYRQTTIYKFIIK